MAHPTPGSTPIVHPRGVFQDEHTFRGVIVYKVYDCSGALVETATVAERWNDPEIAAELAASLNRRCPQDEPHRHGATSAPPTLHLI